MADYRVYLLSPAGRIMDSRLLRAPSDEAARAAARALPHPHVVEIWCGQRLVGRLPPPVAAP